MAQISKYKEGGGLGISLEGTVEKIDGAEQNPHHYIRYRRSRTRSITSGIDGAEPAPLNQVYTEQNPLYYIITSSIYGKKGY